MTKIPKREKLLISILICMMVMMAGLTTNFRVVRANKGLMPVYDDYIETDSVHLPFTDKTQVNYWYLSDVFRMDLPKDYEMFYSIGDLLMLIGLIGLILFIILYFNIIKNDSKNK